MSTVMFDAMWGTGVLLLYLPFLVFPLLVTGIVSLVIYCVVSGRKRRETPPDANSREPEQSLHITGNEKEDANDRSV